MRATLLSLTDMWMQVGSYTNFFADALIAEAEMDKRVLGIHAAMGGGTGMNSFEQRFPDRTFDVGIAEQVGEPEGGQYGGKLFCGL